MQTAPTPAGDVDTSAASFFGWMGVACALVFGNLGCAYGTAKAGVGLCSMGVMSPGLVMKNIVPIVMASILGIYGLIVSVILAGKVPSILQMQTQNEAMNAGYKVSAETILVQIMCKIILRAYSLGAVRQ